VDREREASLAEKINHAIWKKMTPKQAQVSFSLGILPHKWYASRELSLRLGISDVQFWINHKTLPRSMIGKLQHVLGYDYIFFCWKLDDPEERARAQEKAAIASERQARKQLPSLTPVEYKIAREYRIRPSTFYELRAASEITGIPTQALRAWAQSLDLIHQLGGTSYTRGRHVIFHIHERRWRLEAKERRKQGEPVPRYPPTPECYQSPGYKNYLYRIEHRERKARQDKEDRIERRRRRQEKAERWRTEETWRNERHFAIHVEFKEKYKFTEVADLARRKRKTIERWVDKGWVKKIKIGRSVFIERAEVRRLIATNGRPWLTFDRTEGNSLPALSPEEARIARKHHIRPNYRYFLSDAAHRARTSPKVLSYWLIAYSCYCGGCKGGIWGRHIIEYIAAKARGRQN
jgi:hypothetical protein